MQTMTIPVISTAHITKEVAARLTEEGDKNPWVICAPYEYGYFLWINDRENYNPDSVPECLLSIIDKLSTPTAIGVWVRLDSDADPLDGLPVYDW